jgi:hypothetical protein
MDSTAAQVILALITLTVGAVAVIRVVMIKILDSFTNTNASIVKNQEGMISQTLGEFQETRTVLRDISTNLTANTELLRAMRADQQIDRVTAVAVAAAVAATATSAAAQVAKIAADREPKQ